MMNRGWTERVIGKLAGRLRRVAAKTWVLVAIGLTTVLLSTGLIAFAPEPDRQPAEQTAVPVSTLTAESGAKSPEVSLYGRVETPHAASLTAQVAAPVSAVLVRDGERVDAGDVLVRLDETDAGLLVRRRESELIERQADLASLKLAGAEDREVLAHEQELHRLAQDRVARHRQLREQGSISQDTLNAVLQENHARAIVLSRQRNQVRSFEHRLARAQALLDRAQAALEEARVGLRRTSIRAPFAGRVTKVDVALGELVSPGRTVAELYDDRTLEVRVQIPNAHLPVLERALASGYRPAVSVDFGDYRAGGELDRLVGAVAEGQSGVDGLVRLDADVSPPDLGRAVNLRVTMPPIPDAVAVPVPAVYGQRRLFLVRDGLLAGIDVERLGEVTDDDGELKLLVRADELVDGSQILVSPLTNAVTGLRVRMAQEAPTDAGEESSG